MTLSGLETSLLAVFLLLLMYGMGSLGILPPSFETDMHASVLAAPMLCGVTGVPPSGLAALVLRRASAGEGSIA